MSEKKDRVGWTPAAVSDKEVCLFKSMVRGMVNLLLKDDPLPEGYTLTGLQAYYTRDGPLPNNAAEMAGYSFTVMVDEGTLSVYRLEGVK